MMGKKGAILIIVFIMLVGLSGVALAFLTLTGDEIKASGTGLWNMQALYIAQAGLAKARWALTEAEETVGWGESGVAFGEGTYTVTTVDNGDSTYTITSEGYVPNGTNPLAKRRVIEKNIPVTPASENNLSSGATVSASSEQGINTVDKAIDGQSKTRWRSNVSNGSWLKLDFAGPTVFNWIVYTGSSIDLYTLEYSDDDSVYSAVTNAVESPAGTVSFDSVTARYIRFSVNGNRPAVNEFETYNGAAVGVSLDRGKFSTSW